MFHGAQVCAGQQMWDVGCQERPNTVPNFERIFYVSACDSEFIILLPTNKKGIVIFNFDSKLKSII